MRNVADLVSPPRHSPREMTAWTAEEARRFLEIAPQSMHGPIWIVALATGLRKGELAGLR
jgi:integrase